MDGSLPGSSIHGILQARILEWVAMPSSRGIFLTHGSNPHLLCLLHWQAGSSPLAPPGKPTVPQQGKKERPLQQGFPGQSSVTPDTGDLGLGVPGLYTYSPGRVWNSYSPGSRETEAAGSEGICPQRGAELRICLQETWFDSWVGKIPRRRA